MQFQKKTIGRINETGYMKGFKRKGFTPGKCILELVANSLDALDHLENKCIHFDITNSPIKLIDNGLGMDADSLEHMFEMQRENHISDKSRGVSGLGAKVSMDILSGETETEVFTHRKDGPYLKVHVPWNKIHSLGQYTGMIHIEEMNDLEIETFQAERILQNMVQDGEEPTGTTISFPYNEALYSVIKENFRELNDKEESSLKLVDRINIVFGREDAVRFTCSTEEGYKELPLYNYFGGRSIDYYGGIAKETIELWAHNEKVGFIWRQNDGKAFEIHKHGRGFSKKAEESRTGICSYTHIGDYEVLVGLRKQDNIDPQTITGKIVIGSYDSQFIGEDEDYFGSYKLIRNNQFIGLIPSETKLSNARANGSANIDIIQTQVECRFYPTSQLDNRQDHITGIQENKNQFIANLPPNFVRLLAEIKAEKCRQLHALFAKNMEAKEEEIQEKEESPVDDDKMNDIYESEEETEFKQITSTASPVILIDNTSIEDISENLLLETVVEPVAETDDESASEVLVEVVADAPEPAAELPVEPVADAHELATEALAEPVVGEERPRIPIEVKSHRKGWVSGQELRDELMRVYSQITEDASFTDPATIEFFNTLRNVKIGV